MTTRWNPDDLAARIRLYLLDNPEVEQLTVPMMQRVLGGDIKWDKDAEYLPPHFVEQAFQKLNISGELAHAGPRSSQCHCGDHRAATYEVRRKS